MALGWSPWDVYEAVKSGWRQLVDGIDRGYWRLVEYVYKYAVMILLGGVAYEDSVRSGRSQPAVIREFRVDGQNLGLSSSLPVGVVTEGGVVVDYKYSSPRDFHKLSLAGYALALEAEYEVPYDYGLLVYINSHLRRWFVEERQHHRHAPRGPRAASRPPVLR